MSFPLSFLDVSLWLAFAAIIMLITSEMVSFYYGRINVQIDRKRLRNAALIVSILFLATLVIRITGMVLAP